MVINYVCRLKFWEVLEDILSIIGGSLNVASNTIIEALPVN